MSNEPIERFNYVADTQRRIVRVTARQLLTGADLIGIIDRQVREGRWSFGMLYDLRRTDRITSREDAETVVDHVQELVSLHGPRGPVALVTNRADMVATGQIYAFRTMRSMEMEVFWDLQEADAWLAGRVSGPG
jgi:hypothetical protein